MLTASIQDFIGKLTTEQLAQTLTNLAWCIKEQLFRCPHAEFYLPETVMARWFEDEVNNLLLDSQLDLLKKIADQIKTNRQQ